ncbi:MAG: DUF1501 domain-containing protein, partial [Pirellula sp.]
GGFAHMDSFDPKPDAPPEYRGILDPIKTSIPGILFSSHMQQSAKIADRLTIVRSMSHTEVDHSRGEHSMFTGLRCTAIQAINDNELNLTFVADKDCRLDAVPFRLRSDDGLSELKTITITPFPTVSEEHSAEAQQVKPNTTIIGTLEGDDVDSYEIRVQKGQRLSGEVHAMRLGGAMLDTKLTLVGPTGKRIIVSDDSPLLNQDPCFSIIAEEAGAFRVQITSVGANADANSQYALHLGDFPRPQAFFPLGAPANSKVSVSFFQNMPNEHHSISLALSTQGLSPGTHLIEIADGGAVCPSPIPFRVSDAQSVNDPASGAIAPCAFHGLIRAEQPTNQYSFQVPDDGEYCVEVFATRFGSNLDSVIEIADSHRSIVAG